MGPVKLNFTEIDITKRDLPGLAISKVEAIPFLVNLESTKFEITAPAATNKNAHLWW